jgi:lipopolysaccharide export system permease protein
VPTVSIFSRYVFRQAAGALTLILLSLSGIVWIALALRELNVVTSQGQSGWMLLKMTTLALPNLMAIIAPIALLIASVHTLNRLNSDSELIVFMASGASIWSVARPLIVLALVVMGALHLVNHYVMPWSLRQLREAIVQVRTDLLTQVIQPGKFSSPEPGITFHIRERTLDGELRGLIMDDARNNKISQTYLAEHGIVRKQDDSAYLVMSEGHVVRRADPKEPAQILVFDKYVIDLDSIEPKTQAQLDLKPRERYFGELVNPAPGSVNYKLSPGQFRSELHERFANPFYPLAFVMIALAFVGQAQSTRQNRGEQMAMAFGAAILARLGGLAANNAAVITASAVPVLYAIPLGTATLCTIALVRARTPGAGLVASLMRLGEALARPLGAVTRAAQTLARRGA